jgi:hypothetical protein
MMLLWVMFSSFKLLLGEEVGEGREDQVIEGQGIYIYVHI